MASTPSRNHWWHPKRLLMCMNRPPLMDGTSVLGILLLKLSIILLRIFLFLFSRTKICLHYVIHVLLIKHINNLFVSQVFKVMSPLNLFTRMCGDLLVILGLMDHDITLFLLIIIQNIYGFIQWPLNPMFLQFSRISKNLLKPASKINQNTIFRQWR